MNSIINHLNLNDFINQFIQQEQNKLFFPDSYARFTKIKHTINHKTCLNEFKSRNHKKYVFRSK